MTGEGDYPTGIVCRGRNDIATIRYNSIDLTWTGENDDPTGDALLGNVVPAGCGLIDVKVENGVAKLNFTGEFVDLVQNSDGGRMALKALALTCAQFDGVKSVQLYVDGQPYDAGDLGVPSFMNIAENIVDDYIQTQASAVFEVD